MNETLEILDAAPIIDSALTSSLQRVQSEVAAFDKIAAGLAAIEQAHPSNLAVDVTTTAGMKQAIAGRAAYREPRINVEKARKAAKAPVLELGKQIDQFAANLESQLRIGESNYDEQIKAEEARKEAERQAKAEAERVRVALIRTQIDTIKNHAQFAIGKPAEAILNILSGVEGFDVDDSFQELKAEAEAAKQDTIAKLKDLHAAQVQQEAEAARIAAERAAFERQQREAEQARIAEAEAKAKADEKTRSAAFVMLTALHEIEKLTTEPKVKAIAVKAIKSAKE
jgi:hypothetical protein